MRSQILDLIVGQSEGRKPTSSVAGTNRLPSTRITLAMWWGCSKAASSAPRKALVTLGHYPHQSLLDGSDRLLAQLTPDGPPRSR